jgi:predicted AAA+ superfamily ATPase
MIIREQYLRKIRGFYDSDLVKVITGMRRSGKSVLLMQVMSEIKGKSVPADHIIYINFEDFDNLEYTNSRELNEFIKSKIIDTDKYYIFLDEIQNVDKFELVINSLRATQNVSIFITGSNSKLLSGELATHLSGRYVTFRIMPFTFSEVKEYINDNNKSDEEIFNQYLVLGSMPQVYNLKTEEEVQVYLNDLYDSIILHDIIDRFNLKDVDLLNRILQFTIENIGQVFSANSISKFLKSETLSVSSATVYNYLEAIESSLIISRVSRYDIRGKKVIKFYEKFYLTDLGLARLKKSNYEKNTSGRLENIVYNELIARGYKVHIGVVKDGEVDFVVDNFGDISYIQVAVNLAGDGVLERELGAFDSISDNYPKTLLSLDKIDYSRGGVQHRNVIEWLLGQGD